MRWGPAAAVSGLLACAAVTLFPSLRSLELYWREVHDYNHGYLVAGVVLAWLGLRWPELGSREVRPSAGGAALLGVALAVWLVAFAGHSLIGQQLLVPVVLWLSVWAGTGWSAARLLVAPLGYLYFAIPVWELFIPVLQQMTVVAAQTAMAIIGVPAVVNDFTVSIPEGTFSIIEGCSGRKYLVAALATAALGAAINRFDWRRGLLLGALAAGVALVANWIRVTTVIIAGHLTQMQGYLVAVEHRSFGNVIWLAVVAVILVLARRLAPPAATAHEPAASPGGLAPVGTRISRRAGLGTVVPVMLLAATAAVAHWHRDPGASRPALAYLPLATAEWQGPLPASSAWQPQFTGASEERRSAYASRAGTVEIYVNVYGRQRPGHKLLSAANTVLGPGEWQRIDRAGFADALSAATGRLPTQLTATDPDGDRWVIAYAYQIGARRTGSEVVGQILYGAGAVLRPPTAGVLAVAARCADAKCTAARGLVASAWSQMNAPLGSLIGDARPAPGLDPRPDEVE